MSSALCWGDAARIQKLKQTLRTERDAAAAAPVAAAVAAAGCDLQPKESDTCSRGRTSCSSSSHDGMWDDDDDASAIGSHCSSRSDDDSSSSDVATPVTSPASGSPRHELRAPLPLALGALWTDKTRRAKPSSPASALLGPRQVVPIVAPLELGPPSEYDLRSTNGLLKCVDALAPLPTVEQLAAKHLVIHELQRTVDRWLRHTLADVPGACSTATATLLVGGSWHLKVGGADADLDVVALLPHAVTADAFFGSLGAHLARDAAVSNLVARRAAAVPVLSFERNAVRVDLLFARYAPQQDVPRHLACLSDGPLVRGMDTASVRSLSVARVASLVLELVPNASTFRSCLRVVRLWATRRGLYSNKAGFLGGVSWALLVCFVCQLFPRASVAALVHRFFTVLAAWQWPTPVRVARPARGDSAGSVEWDPHQHRRDRAHCMPIITPGFPAVNTAVNVNVSTLRVMRDEFARGRRIMDDLRRAGASHPLAWPQLFARTEVLVRYDHYVAIELRASSEEALAEWSGFVASRTRKLVETLQHTPSVGALHPLPEMVRPRRLAPEDGGGGEAAAGGPVVGYYFIGYTVNAPSMPGVRLDHSRRRGERRPLVPNGCRNEEFARHCIAPATRYFLATELSVAAEKKGGMEVAISYASWNDLPDAIFPGGRPAAIGDRARDILSRAHQTNLALGFAR